MSDLFTNGYAVIIGVDDSPIDYLRLPAVAKDVNALYDVLTDEERCGYPKEQVRLVTGKNATRGNIIKALRWLRDQVANKPNATAVIYYSGHGQWDKVSEYHLIPYDVTSIPDYKDEAIEATHFSRLVASIRSERVLIIMDCCHASGMDMKDITLDLPFTERPFPINQSLTKGLSEVEHSAKNFDQLGQDRGRAVLNSSQGDEKSYVRADGRMSVFTYHLIEALTGHASQQDGARTVYVTDIMTYVHAQVKETTAQSGMKQTPDMMTNGVFPVAMLMGGKGIEAGKSLPDPLDPLPGQSSTQNTSNRSVNTRNNSGTIITGDGNIVGDNTRISTTTFDQSGQSVTGNQYNATDMNIGHIGDTVNTGGGDYIRGNQKNVRSGGVDISGPATFHGGFAGRDLHQGDIVSGDSYNVGNITGSQGVAIGRGAQANVTNTYGGGSDTEVAQVQRLLDELERLLSQTNDPRGEDSANVLDEIVAIRQELSSRKPTPRKLNKYGQRLQEAAVKFSRTVPAIVATANNIVTLVQKIAG